MSPGTASGKIAAVLSLLVVSLLAGACSSREGISYKKPRYDIAKVDTGFGVAYPYEFGRALDLRSHEMFVEASYIYINLFPTAPDSVVSSVIAMAEEIKAVDSLQTVSYYINQGLGTQVVHDPAVFDKETKQLKPAELKRRYQWTSELVGALMQRGVR